MKILIINGPNLNLLGRREPGIYGALTFEDYLETLRAAYPDDEIAYYQSNHEGDIVDAIHMAGFGDEANLNAAYAEKYTTLGRMDGIVLNAGAYTHTSVAIHDAIKAVKVPVIEVHLSNIHTREEFRHHSVISPVVMGQIAGFGSDSYYAAMAVALRKLKA